jgi:hypothetical protein
VNGAFIFQQNIIIFLKLNTSWLDLSIVIKFKMKYSKEMLVNEKVKKKLSPLKLLSFIFIFTLIFIDFQRSRLVNSVNCINFVSFDEIIKTITITNRQNKKMSGLRFFFVHHICLKFTKKKQRKRLLSSFDRSTEANQPIQFYFYCPQDWKS